MVIVGCDAVTENGDVVNKVCVVKAKLIMLLEVISSIYIPWTLLFILS